MLDRRQHHLAVCSELSGREFESIAVVADRRQHHLAVCSELSGRVFESTAGAADRHQHHLAVCSELSGRVFESIAGVLDRRQHHLAVCSELSGRVMESIAVAPDRRQHHLAICCLCLGHTTSIWRRSIDHAPEEAAIRYAALRCKLCRSHHATAVQARPDLQVHPRPCLNERHRDRLVLLLEVDVECGLHQRRPAIRAAEIRICVRRQEHRDNVGIACPCRLDECRACVFGTGSDIQHKVHSIDIGAHLYQTRDGLHFAFMGSRRFNNTGEDGLTRRAERVDLSSSSLEHIDKLCIW